MAVALLRSVFRPTKPAFGVTHSTRAPSSQMGMSTPKAPRTRQRSGKSTSMAQSLGSVWFSDEWFDGTGCPWLIPTDFPRTHSCVFIHLNTSTQSRQLQPVQSFHLVQLVHNYMTIHTGSTFQGSLIVDNWVVILNRSRGTFPIRRFDILGIAVEMAPQLKGRHRHGVVHVETSHLITEMVGDCGPADPLQEDIALGCLPRSIYKDNETEGSSMLGCLVMTKG